MTRNEYNAGEGSSQEATDFERAHVQSQLRLQDDPYKLISEVGLHARIIGIPRPAFPGQVLAWTDRTHFCGRVIETVFLKALVWNGQLGWVEFKLGTWL